jgi:galactonate dehydratase
LIGSVVAGIDVALWDIKGKMLNRPVYDLLGGRCRDFVQCFLAPTYRTKGARRTTYDGSAQPGLSDAESARAMATLAKECLEDGHHFFRISPENNGGLFSARESVRRCVAQLRAVREAVGNQLDLMVDLHTRLSPDESVWFCREVEPLEMYCVEDPIRAEHVAGYRRLRAQTNVPLAAGEQWANKWEFRQAIEEELVDYARVDICIAGGLTEARKIAAMAETHYVKLLPHNPLGPVCTAASLHLDLACDNAGPQEVFFPPDTMLPDVFECSFKLDGSRLTLPTAPGIGVKFNVEAAKAHPAEMTEPPHLHRDDGSFTNY